jgi:DUF4097 and DUF4098 domain-containing protein YvlB
LFKSHEGVAGLVTFSSKGATGTKALNVKLLVPKLFKKINIETISADFKILGVGVEELNINNISGDFDMNNLNSQHVKLNTVSGDIDFRDLSFTSVKVDTVSGDIKFQYSNPMDLKAEITSVSGDLSGDDFYKKFINGNTLQVIQRVETQTPPEITINSISGDVEFIRRRTKTSF